MLLSVVTATFNSERTVADTLRSVTAQRHPQVEHVVVDGASGDGTLDVVRAHAGRVARLISEPDRGIYDALNKGLRACSGEVVGILHADDVYSHDDVLPRVAAAFADCSVDVVYGDLLYVRRNDMTRTVRYWRAGDFTPARLRNGWMPPHPTVFVRRRVYDRIGLFDDRLRIAADYELMLRLFGGGARMHRYLPEVLVRMRVGGQSNRSLRNVIVKTSEDARAMLRHGLPLWRTLPLKNLSKVGQFWMRPPH